jgi:hypothetical protein
LCLVLAAAPGGGKTSVSRALLETEPELALSVSATTRAPRPGECEGEHYYFRTPEQFAAGVAAGEFLEHASFLGRSYGTPRAPVEAALAAGRRPDFTSECPRSVRPESRVLRASRGGRTSWRKGRDKRRKPLPRLVPAQSPTELIELFKRAILHTNLAHPILVDDLHGQAEGVRQVVLKRRRVGVLAAG